MQVLSAANFVKKTVIKQVYLTPRPIALCRFAYGIIFEMKLSVVLQNIFHCHAC